jgi:hypothetical protein
MRGLGRRSSNRLPLHLGRMVGGGCPLGLGGNVHSPLTDLRASGPVVLPDRLVGRSPLIPAAHASESSPVRDAAKFPFVSRRHILHAVLGLSRCASITGTHRGRRVGRMDRARGPPPIELGGPAAGLQQRRRVVRRATRMEGVSEMTRTIARSPGRIGRPEHIGTRALVAGSRCACWCS